MADRVLEIVVFLMSQIRDHQGQLDNLDDISSYLKNNGFTDNEISSAYLWVLDQLQSESHLIVDDSHSQYSFRILSDHERRHFATDAIGYLLQLRHLGLLNDSQMELILERATFLAASPVDLDQIKIIVSSMLFRELDSLETGRQPVFLSQDDSGHVN